MMIPMTDIAMSADATAIPPLAFVSLWYSVPLIVSVSLVCAATRHELMAPILNHAARFGMWLLVFMGLIMGLIGLLQRLA
jgi:hypothetical protein